MVIVGIVSAVAYPNFSDWRKEREVRQGVAKIQSLIKNIYTQTERGTFAFVQVLINPTDTHIFITVKGMTMQTLASKINNGSDVWNNPNDVIQDVILMILTIGILIRLLQEVILKMQCILLISLM